MSSTTIWNEAAESLRLLFISRALPVHRLGGLEFHLRDLALALAQRGHTIGILTTKGGGEDPLPGEAAGLPGSITVFSMQNTVPGDYSIGFFRHLQRELRANAKDQSWDMIIPVDLAGLFLPPMLDGIRIVPLIHGTLTTEVPLDRRYWKQLSAPDKLKVLWRYKPRLALQKPFERMLTRMTAILVDSEFSRRELLLENTPFKNLDSGSYPSEKIRVIPLGIDPTRYPARPELPRQGTHEPAGPLRIAMLGRLQELKGIRIALIAAGQLKLRGISFQLSIGGTGDFADEADALVREMNLEENVHLPGRVPPEAIGRFFLSHDVFLFPDLTQPAFGLVAVEAMLYHLPVIAARSGAIPEVVTPDVGWLYDPWDASALADVLSELCNDRQLVALKATGCRERVKNFTAAAMAGRVEAALGRICLGEGL